MDKKEKVYKGIHPFSFQKAVIDELTDNVKGTGKNVVVLSRRQAGKSTLIANILLYYSINYYKSKNYCVSPTVRQAKNLYKTIIDALGNCGLIKSSNGTDLSLVFINGSEIKFLSAEMKQNLRGYTCTGILCIDEAAYISDEVFNIIRPWVDFHKAVTLMVSTPFTKQGFFWQYYNYGIEQSHNTVSINWSDEIYKEDMNKILSPERLKEYEEILPKNVFRTEYLGEWIEDGGMVFNGYKECILDVDILPTDSLYVGIDWANGGEHDDTVISIFNQRGQQVLLRYWNNLSTNRQIEYIAKIIETYENQIVSVQPELNSIGTPYTDILKKRLQVSTQNKINGFNTTNASKNDLVSNIQVAFEQKKITLLNDDKQIRQFGYYAAEYNPTTKNITYNAPTGLHDDCVMATMIAYDAYLNRGNSGSYTFSF